VEGTGRVKASELPAGKAVVTCHVGPYEALPTSHARLEAWLKAQSLESRGGFWETYLTDPGIEPDPSKWRTLLVWPVK
jgi:effector-binding domain-containing protein